MKLETLTLEQCEQVRIWRNAEMEVWRTPFMLTESMQAEFYYEKVSNRHSEHRYWAIGNKDFFLGMGGITHIQWENRIGEITLIIDPEKRKDGLGEKAVDLLLDQAFNHLNLQTVDGECYLCNPAWEFWVKMVVKYQDMNHVNVDGDVVTWEVRIPNRKTWKGDLRSAIKFSIDKDDFNKIHNNK